MSMRGKIKRSWLDNSILLFSFSIMIGTGINILLNSLAYRSKLPIFLDTVGTIFASALGGYLSGIIVALVTNLIVGFMQPLAVYYGIVNIICAAVTVYFFKKNWINKSVWALLRFILVLTFISGTLGTGLTLALQGFAAEPRYYPILFFFYNKLRLGAHLSQWLCLLVVNFIDKTLVVLISLGLSIFFPKEIREKLHIQIWGQKPLSDQEKEAAKHVPCKGASLNTKFIVLLTFASFTLALIATVISLVLFRGFTRDQHVEVAQGASRLAASILNVEQIDAYLKEGRKAEGYLETERMLYQIKATHKDIQFLYVYKIEEDGYHVIFDLDADGIKGTQPGEVDPFEESVLPYVPDLVAGKKVQPFTTNDQYGWLMTVYTPVYDANRECVCYAGVDISMKDLALYEKDFLVKLLSLFLCFYCLILALGIWFAEYNIVLPINTIAICSSEFAYNSEVAREENVERIRNLDIHTGDEVENLYHAIVRTAEDSMLYMQDLHKKTELIEGMQSGLIMLLADMVENRDESTGDHVRRTAAYTAVIMKEMRKKGYYKNTLTERYMQDVEKSAPLHDIGKIHIPDAILNKPGRLTAEEFEIIKTHTTAGAKILEHAIESIPGASYLREAKNLAEFHHEKWNGTGYPRGLSGKNIPLSARIMAVADVFDALTSKRVYKDAFTFEEAMDIIKKDSGSHFDPKVVDAFVSGEAEVREIAEKFKQ